MKHLNAGLAFAAALSLFATVAPARAEPPKNIVLVHGAWVDASGWKPVYEILTKEGEACDATLSRPTVLHQLTSRLKALTDGS